MDGQLRIVGIGGSLVERSTSLQALRVALSGAAAEGASTELAREVVRAAGQFHARHLTSGHPEGQGAAPLEVGS